MLNHSPGTGIVTKRKGFVLPAVVFSIAIMSIIVVVALSTADDERRASRATRESTLATYAAEAGLRKTLGSLPSASMAALNSGDSLDLGWQMMPNKAAYRAVIHRADNGGTNQYAVVVQGRRTGINGGQSTIVAQVANGAIHFSFSVYAQGKLTISGGGLSDSYDSDVGAYNAATANSNGDIAGDSIIQLSGTTIVKGDVIAAGTVSGGIVSGSVTQHAAPFPANAVLSCPAGGYTPAASVPAAANVTYIPATGFLKVSGGTLTLPVPPTQYYFSTVQLAGGAKIVFNNPTNQHVDLWIDDLLDLSGGSVSNPSGKATLLGIWACGSIKTSAWTLSGGSNAYFSVYAPNHDLTVSGSGDLWGSIAAKTVNFSGGSKVHYDEVLGRGPPTGLNAVAGSWAQLPGN
jgi:hypothetical protein